MTDREFLELAAKAAGELTPDWYGNDAYFDGVLQRWNPLTDDGDALRLAVKLDFRIDIDNQLSMAAVYANSSYNIDVMVETDDNNDTYAATRRAIVRAAAAIGRAVE